jgi:hypothetical protein
MMNQARDGGAAVQILVGVVAALVLALILFPVVFRERVPSRKLQCQHTMKEWAVALLCYADDYDGCLPSSACVNWSEEWERKNFLTFATKKGRLPLRAGERPKTWAQLLSPYMEYAEDVFCPSGSVDTSPDDATVSYWWKLAVDKAWYGDKCEKTYRKIADYPGPKDCIVLYEHMGWHFDQTDGLLNGVQINCAFLDSHVKVHTIVNATSGDPANCAANSDGEPMYFNFDEAKGDVPGNPPKPNVPATHIDPGRYSDRLD